MPLFKKFACPVTLLAIAVLFKFILLDRVPGINADEAIGTVWMRDYLQGLSPWPWWTPTNRILVPIFPALALLVAEVFPPGFGYMRLVPAFSHVALLAAAWLTLRRKLDASHLLLFLLLLASLPLHTAFARIAWEPCLIPVMCYLAVFFALNKHFVAACLMLFAAILTHSTCIFLAPVLFILWAAELTFPPENRERRYLDIAAFVILAAITVAMARLVFAAAADATNGAISRDIWNRATDVNGWMEFFGLFFYTVTGKTSFSEFTGVPMESRFLPSIRILGLMTAAAFLGLLYVFIRCGKKQSAILLSAFAVSLLSFYLVAGKLPVTVGYQRYSLWMGVPLVFIIYDALTLSRFKNWPILVLSAGLLAYTAYGYFYNSLTKSIASFPPVYASGTPEPKRAAFEWIHSTLASEGRLATATASKQGKLPVLADSWWLFWTGRYWLYDDPLDFYHAEQPIPTGLPPDRQLLTAADMKIVLEREGFVIAFSHGPVAKQLQESGLNDRYKSITFNDAADLPLLSVWHGERDR